MEEEAEKRKRGVRRSVAGRATRTKRGSSCSRKIPLPFHCREHMLGRQHALRSAEEPGKENLLFPEVFPSVSITQCGVSGAQRDIIFMQHSLTCELTTSFGI